MLRKNFVSAGILIVAVLLSFSSFSFGYKKGEMIFVPWAGFEYHQGKIIEIVGDNANVIMVNKMKHTVKLKDIKPIVRPAKITVGLVCLAEWVSYSFATSNYAKAKVIKIAGDDVTVEFLPAIGNTKQRTVKKYKIFKF